MVLLWKWNGLVHFAGAFILETMMNCIPQVAQLKGSGMSNYLKIFERIIITSLVVMMAMTVVLVTVELGWLIIKEVITPPFFIAEPKELMDIFGLFLLVLVGIELVYTLKTYLTENELHVEVVLMAALIAIGRKVIILDPKDLAGPTLVGIAAVIFALLFGYYFIRKTHLHKDR